MSNVVPFPAVARGQATLEQVAEQIIDELGSAAGFEVGRLARASGLTPVERRRLLALADEIAVRQGYSWYFPGDDEADVAS